MNGQSKSKAGCTVIPHNGDSSSVAVIAIVIIIPPSKLLHLGWKQTDVFPILLTEGGVACELTVVV